MVLIFAGRTKSSPLILDSCCLIATKLVLELVTSVGFYVQLPWVGVQWTKCGWYSFKELQVNKRLLKNKYASTQSQPFS